MKGVAGAHRIFYLCFRRWRGDERAAIPEGSAFFGESDANARAVHYFRQLRAAFCNRLGRARCVRFVATSAQPECEPADFAVIQFENVGALPRRASPEDLHRGGFCAPVLRATLYHSKLPYLLLPGRRLINRSFAQRRRMLPDEPKR
jgi:hypothetical protein